jgi:hypothetical protein
MSQKTRMRGGGDKKPNRKGENAIKILKTGKKGQIKRGKN